MSIPEIDTWELAGFPGRLDVAAYLTADQAAAQYRVLVDAQEHYGDLHPLDAEYARGQRSWLAGQATDMTGGTVELRTEGMLLRLPEDQAFTAGATPAFPAVTATAWFALKVLDAAIAEGSGQQDDPAGRITLAGEQVNAIVGRVYRDNFRALTKALADSPARLRSAVEQVLAGLGLVRAEAGGWVILPVAARYRDPRAVWEQVLEDVS